MEVPAKLLETAEELFRLFVWSASSTLSARVFFQELAADVHTCTSLRPRHPHRGSLGSSHCAVCWECISASRLAKDRDDFHTKVPTIS